MTKTDIVISLDDGNNFEYQVDMFLTITVHPMHQLGVCIEVIGVAFKSRLS